jgi:hypothetical protein
MADYQDKLITPEEERELVSAILKSTRFENKFFDFEEGTEVAKKLMECGFAPKVYCSIVPEIQLTRTDVPDKYSKYFIDLRRYRNGADPACDHLNGRSMINLYWEVGGSMMDSGVPHNYRMCCRCGYSDTRVESFNPFCLILAFFRKAFSFRIF